MRKLARIERILAIDPIPGADAIEVAIVGGWKVVVKKGLYNVDSLAVYFEVDALLPRRPWSEFLFKDTRELYRLKTIKLRGQISQGLLVPIAEIPELGGTDGFGPERWMVEGADVTELLKVLKWEPVLPANLAGKVKGNFPPFLRKTDEERIQNAKRVLDEIKDIPIYVGVKMDGTSASYYNHEGRFGACSRNLELKEEGGDDYWAAAKALDLPNKLPDGYAISAELCGPSIQGNKMGLKDKTLFVFNVWDIKNQRYLDFNDFIGFCVNHGLYTVPLVPAPNPRPQTVEEWLAFADTVKYPNGAQAEGVVIRALDNRYSPALDGRLSFKVIANSFLLKHSDA